MLEGFPSSFLGPADHRATMGQRQQLPCGGGLHCTRRGQPVAVRRRAAAPWVPFAGSRWEISASRGPAGDFPGPASGRRGAGSVVGQVRKWAAWRRSRSPAHRQLLSLNCCRCLFRRLRAVGRVGVSIFTDGPGSLRQLGDDTVDIAMGLWRIHKRYNDLAVQCRYVETLTQERRCPAVPQDIDAADVHAIVRGIQESGDRVRQESTTWRLPERCKAQRCRRARHHHAGRDGT